MGTYQEWVYPGLLLFGIAFNWFIGIAEQRGWTEGYLSFFVAGGSAVTIGGIWLLNHQAGAMALTCFVLSGLPMMIGSMARHMQKRERTQDRYKGGGG